MWADRFVGLRWAELGRTWGGCDCWGLVRLVLMEECQIILPRYDTVAPSDYSETIEAKRKLPEWVSVLAPAARDFDLVRMWTAVKLLDGKRVRAPVHIGVIAGTNVLHMQEGDAAVCEPFASLKSRVVEIVRHKGLAHGNV